MPATTSYLSQVRWYRGSHRSGGKINEAPPASSWPGWPSLLPNVAVMTLRPPSSKVPWSGPLHAGVTSLDGRWQLLLLRCPLGVVLLENFQDGRPVLDARRNG